jgi:purine-binding chemotaxis protein CheW
VSIQGHDIGVYVDAVSEVLAINDDIIETPDSLVLDFDSTYLTGIAKLDTRLILLLDLAAALDIVELPDEMNLVAA